MSALPATSPPRIPGSAPQQRDTLGQTACLVVRVGQVRARGQGVRVNRPQDPLAAREGLLVELDRGGQPPGRVVDGREVAAGGDRVQVICAVKPALVRQY